MSDCAYGSNSSLSWRDSVKMSGCAYGSSGPIFQVMSIAMAFLFLVRVVLANQSRLILVGASVSFVRVLALATVVVIFSTVARVMSDTSTEYDKYQGQGQYPEETDSRYNNNQPGLVRQSYSDKKQKGLGD